MEKATGVNIFDSQIFNLLKFLYLRRAFSIFCPFAFKARSTTLIFVECITLHQTSLLDDVHKVLVVFTSHKLCFYVFEYTPHILKYNRSGLTWTLKLPARKRLL